MPWRPLAVKAGPLTWPPLVAYACVPFPPGRREGTRAAVEAAPEPAAVAGAALGDALRRGPLPDGRPGRPRPLHLGPQRARRPDRRSAGGGKKFTPVRPE